MTASRDPEPPSVLPGNDAFCDPPPLRAGRRARAADGHDVDQGLPLSVWPTAQRSSRAQRSGRYLAESMAHPGKMLPALARHAVAVYSRPGDVVLDPMCGIGTTPVETVHLGRTAVGIEYEPRWADLAHHNLSAAAAQGATGDGEVLAGDARDAIRLLHRRYRGRVALLLTSPPYGSTTHGRVHRTADGRVSKVDHRYSTDRANLAHRPLPALLEGFTEILDACLPLLAPGAVAVVTARPYRRDGRLVDFPSAVIAAAAEAGFALAERNVALLAGIRGDRLVPRASFFALHHLHSSRRAVGHRHLLVHEDVLVFVPR